MQHLKFCPDLLNQNLSSPRPPPPIPVHSKEKAWLDQDFMGSSSGLLTASSGASLPPSPLAALNQVTNSLLGKTLLSDVVSSRRWAGLSLQLWVAGSP